MGVIHALAATSLAVGQIPTGQPRHANHDPRYHQFLNYGEQTNAFNQDPTIKRLPSPIVNGTLVAHSLDDPQAGFQETVRRPSIAELMLPTFQFSTDWHIASNLDVSEHRARITVPTYPFFGPPPPMISAGLAFTNLDAPDALNLPDNLYDYSLGFSWMRRINDRWMTRFMFSAAFASDGENVSSDAWQFRGGAFGIYQPSPEWTWTIGALALGRNDIPVVPAVGVIWQPSHDLRLDLIFPRPRISRLIADSGDRQQWVFAGAGFGGGTWAFQDNGTDDQLTYGNWQLTLGWESTPTKPPGVPFVRGRKLSAEVGYVFARDIEFDSDRPTISFDDAVLLRATVGF